MIEYLLFRENNKIGLKRQDHFGLVKTVDRIDVFAKGQQGPLASIIPIDRLILVPFGLGELDQQCFDLAGQGR